MIFSYQFSPIFIFSPITFHSLLFLFILSYLSDTTGCFHGVSDVLVSNQTHCLSAPLNAIQNYVSIEATSLVFPPSHCIKMQNSSSWIRVRDVALVAMSVRLQTLENYKIFVSFNKTHLENMLIVLFYKTCHYFT
jgi:hypothetical protein